MARPHIADRWSIGVAHDGKDPWSGLNRRFRATGVFDGNWKDESEELQRQTKEESVYCQCLDS